MRFKKFFAPKIESPFSKNGTDYKTILKTLPSRGTTLNFLAE
jgi:hypothetical protein